MSKKTKGYFISFEGGEGVGKSTQVKLLRDQLHSQGIDVVLTREPGGSPSAEKIRQLLLTGDVDKWTPMTEALLFYAARAEHLAKTILPALDQGLWVITDRYADSTYAYQGAGHGLGRKDLDALHQAATGGIWPDLTLILDVEASHGLERATARESAIECEDSREDRFERMESAFHEDLRAEFLKIARRSPDRCRLIDAQGSLKEVSTRIWQQVALRFELGED